MHLMRKRLAQVCEHLLTAFGVGLLGMPIYVALDERHSLTGTHEQVCIRSEVL